jgi:hypothetical protein
MGSSSELPLSEEESFLAEQAEIRNDFEYAVDRALSRSVKVRITEAADYVLGWAKVLGEVQPAVDGVAVLTWVEPGEVPTVSCLGRIDRADWDAMVRIAFDDFDKGAIESRAVIDTGGTSTFEGYLLIETIPESSPKCSLAVASRSKHRELIRWMLKRVALQAGLGLAMQARERAYRQMAERVSHMCSSSLLVAWHRLDDLRTRGEGLSDEGYNLLTQAMDDVEDAQRGFERARLLALPPDLYAEDFDFVDLMQVVRSGLPDEALAPLADSACLVRGAKNRLGWAFRDLILVAWLLGEKRRPVEVSFASRDHSLKVLLLGGALPPALRTGSLEAKLRNPDTYLVTPDRKYRGECAIGLELAWSSIEASGGRLRVNADEGGRLRFQASLRVPGGRPVSK